MPTNVFVKYLNKKRETSGLGRVFQHHGAAFGDKSRMAEGKAGSKHQEVLYIKPKPAFLLLVPTDPVSDLKGHRGLTPLPYASPSVPRYL